MPATASPRIAPGLAIALSAIAALAGAANADVNFLTQERWIEVTVPSDSSGVTRVAAPSFAVFNKGLTDFGTDSNGAGGKGDANQNSSLGTKITATGAVSGIGGGPLGTGFGSGESYFKTTFTVDSDTDFSFVFSASSFDNSVVQFYSFSLLGDGVSFASNPDQYRLLFGQNFDLSGSGTLKAGKEYELIIDLYAMGDGSGATGDGTFDFTMTMIPAPGGSAVACVIGVFASRRRR